MNITTKRTACGYYAFDEDTQESGGGLTEADALDDLIGRLKEVGREPAIQVQERDPVCTHCRKLAVNCKCDYEERELTHWNMQQLQDDQN